MIPAYLVSLVMVSVIIGAVSSKTLPRWYRVTISVPAGLIGAVYFLFSVLTVDPDLRADIVRFCLIVLGLCLNMVVLYYDRQQVGYLDLIRRAEQRAEQAEKRTAFLLRYMELNGLKIEEREL